MFKTISLTAVMVLASFSAGAESADTADRITPWLGCHNKSQLEKVLNDGEYISFSRGKGPDGRLNELWLNDKGDSVTIAFPAPKGGDSNSISTVCVLNVTKNTVYNGEVLESLGKSSQQGSKL